MTPATASTAVTTPVIEARNIVKEYGHVRALRGADFDVRQREIVGLVGDNGAGKSTLVKILSGAIQPDGGQLLINGKPATLSPTKAREAGIETVYQDLALCPDLDVEANLFLGKEMLRPGLLGAIGWLNKSTMRQRAAEAIEDLGVAVQDLAAELGGMSGGQRQGIAVARAATWARDVIFLDEPTAALGVKQSRKVEELITRVRDERGIAIVLISHNMQQVMSLADRIHVMRLGRRAATFDAKAVEAETLVAAMTGLYREEQTQEASWSADGSEEE